MSIPSITGGASMTNRIFQSEMGRVPPWATPACWQEASDALDVALGTRAHRFIEIRELAAQIQARMTVVDRFMAALCQDTCYACTDNCCRRATVWYDFKDLLGFHSGTAPIPPAQLAPAPNRPCQHLEEAGCALPRSQRPFVCTWYICTAQREAMQAWPRSHQQFIGNSLVALKSGRNRMEKLFVRQVVM